MTVLHLAVLVYACGSAVFGLGAALLVTDAALEDEHPSLAKAVARLMFVLGAAAFGPALAAIVFVVTELIGEPQ